jgi:XRE family aerobic/anaerobic benzoate catabolism transcriptional regulator
MAGHQEAMSDLRRILDSRAAFYSKADHTVDTSGMTAEQACESLVASLRTEAPEAPEAQEAVAARAG